MGEQPSIELLPKQHQLLEQLVLAGQELSGQDLHARLRGTPLAMGLATVYRHLRQLHQSSARRQQRWYLRCPTMPYR